MAATVALTGATGFVGSVLAQRLASDGWQVRALVRPTADLRRLPLPGVEPVQGALDDPSSLRRLVRGARVVLHCAGVVRGRDAAHFDEVNVKGVAGLVVAAETEAPGARFILVSSLAARRPDLSWYAASKRAGELALASTATTLRWAVLRPPAVYGPGDRELRPLLQWMVRGIAPVLGPREARFSLVHVDDLAAAAVRLLAHEAAGRTFDVHDGRDGGYSWKDVADAVQQVVGRRIVRVRVPASALHVAARLALVASRLGGRPPMLTPGKVREVTHPDWICDNTPLTLATGWRPRVPILEGLACTLREWRGGA